MIIDILAITSETKINAVETPALLTRMQLIFFSSSFFAPINYVEKKFDSRMNFA
jgi:hypothetical protein